jgi:signal transduction histidine kinase
MRRRLAASYVLLLVLVLAALEVPLAIATASGNSQRVALDRLADAVNFASMAETAITSEPSSPGTEPQLESLRTELMRYEEMYGIGALVVDRDRQTLVSSRAGLTLSSADARRQRDRALAGNQPDASHTVWPWEEKPMVIAAPIGSGGETLGAVITISPTDKLRDSTGQVWLLLAGGGLLALVVFVLMALALARWTLRPIADLDSAVHDISGGDYDRRVPSAAGPPELRRLASAFNEMVSTVSDVLERQRSFVSHASHQLRNPLTALRLRVEDLSEAVPGDEGRTALQETERLSEVLDSLLALASAEKGRFGWETVDADAVAAGRIAAWQPLAVQHSVSLRRVPALRPMTVRTVTTAVSQALDALIDNALKYGATSVSVWVRPSPDGDVDGIAVHVVDNGPGMNEEQRHKATERFWRAPTSQNTVGSGLGLPIVAVLVETSGGKLDLREAEPQGLEAVLWFPSAN